MKYLLILLMLSGCGEDRWKTMICPPHSNQCYQGDVIFATFEDCNKFNEIAKLAQPTVGRMCMKVIHYKQS